MTTQPSPLVAAQTHTALSLAERLQQQRLQQSLTVEMVAKQLNVSLETIYAMERHAETAEEQVNAYAQLLGVTITPNKTAISQIKSINQMGDSGSLTHPLKRKRRYVWWLSILLVVMVVLLAAQQAGLLEGL